MSIPKLRVRAARHGRSMEAELRQILKEALGAEKQHPEPNLAEAIRRRFLPLGGANEIELHPAGAGRRPDPVRAVIVLDTNVLSELMRSQPAAAVFACGITVTGITVTVYAILLASSQHYAIE